MVREKIVDALMDFPGYAHILERFADEVEEKYKGH